MWNLHFCRLNSHTQNDFLNKQSLTVIGRNTRRERSSFLVLTWVPHLFINPDFRNLDYVKHSAGPWRYCSEQWARCPYWFQRVLEPCERGVEGLGCPHPGQGILPVTQVFLSGFRRQNGPSRIIQGTKSFPSPSSLVFFLNKLMTLSWNPQLPDCGCGEMHKLPPCQGTLGMCEYFPLCLHSPWELWACMNSYVEQTDISFLDELRRGELASIF